jgi:putative aldouronate transport system substrate-binding protein
MKKLLTAGVILLAATTLVGCGSKSKKRNSL